MLPVPRLSWWLITGEVLFLAMGSTLASWVMFTVLPLSVALVIMATAISTFPFLRKRLSAGDHFLYVSAAWVALSMFCFLLLHWLGRERLKWLLDWN